ncbi:MAG: isocitrate dehydrogenase [Deltaproteobacteria bacterium]|nr:isocitrate dehydrogenase [Deltaproteobacteria bacterium]
MTHKVTLIPGDWIGPETCAVVQTIIKAAGVDIDWDVQELTGDGLTPELLASCRSTKVILKGKVASPRKEGHLPPTIELRKALGLWSTVRPVSALPNRGARFPEIDLVVVRETSEDIYSGFEHEVTEGVFEAVKITTRAACERIAKAAFELARSHNRSKVTIVHKSNIMKKSDGLFLKVCQDVGKNYPDIETEEAIVDALCMRLVKNPLQFDVILTANLFGDIVSDLCSGLAGGITAAPSASYGDNIALFENPHGNAPKLVGVDLANPIPMLRSALLMLDHLGEHAASARIMAALESCCREGAQTVDQGGNDGCTAIQAAIIDALQ